MAQNIDERALVAAAQRGDLDAFNQLVIHYQKLAYHVAYRVLNDADASADATQDAFLRAYKALDQYRGGSFKAWLLRIVTNTCYDQLRAKRRRPTASLEALLVTEPVSDPLFVDRTESPEAYAERQELGQVIQAGINTLLPDQRIALTLRDMAGMDYQEIAEVTRVSLGTVKSRISRARAKLRDHLLAHQELLPAQYRLKDDTQDVK
jgi:RNA polymerase sigma-70 factor (ECF subfamily)